MHVSALAIYPLKSGRAVPLQATEIDRLGLKDDRRLLLVSPDGQFMTQREFQDLARLAVTVSDAGGYDISMNGKGSIHVALPDGTHRKDVTIWDDVTNAAVADAASNAALSEWLGRQVELVYYDDRAHRSASETWTGDTDTEVSFTDGYPILVTTTASVEALKADMESHGEGSAGMDRFRPNIVIDGSEAWAEDGWAAIEIGGIRFDLVKPCARCIMTTQDQMSGSREVPSPIPAMGRLRMSADRRVPGPLFGWNVVPRGTGTIRLGDAVTVLKTRPEGWAFKRR